MKLPIQQDWNTQSLLHPPACFRLPSKYILVPRPEGVAVRYLLVFSDDALLGQPAGGAHGRPRHGAAALCMYITVAYAAVMVVLAVWGSWRRSTVW